MTFMTFTTSPSINISKNKPVIATPNIGNIIT
jgi:hypothetical protein